MATWPSVISSLPSENSWLPHEVRTNDLSKMSEPQLEGRLRFYEREAIFERDDKIRAENRAEMQRTKSALDIRKGYRLREANRVFA